MYTITLQTLDVEHLIKQYIFFRSVFNCSNFDYDDIELNRMIQDLQKYINERIGD